MIKETEKKRKGWSWFFVPDERLWLRLWVGGILMGFVDGSRRNLEKFLWVEFIVHENDL